MCKLAFVGAAFIFAAFTAVDAHALPIAPSDPASQIDQVIQIRQGCGLGWHRGPGGGCRRNTAAGGPRGANRCWFVRTQRGARKICR
ncbi:GCG_CRPN prefix-to-repeats domain-containing protein [Bradyrhizobium sp. LHD-71]|uniref:GCG_CRPN prefix-to-repeats domain-containing protein n=1 Tax=Bradyrhizobium sp. LHD-71 TaxID=3072141 RepID=UPI0035BE7175